MSYDYFNRHDYDHEQTVVSLLKKSLKLNRDKTAIVYGDITLTYGELNRLSNKIANYLIEAGAGKETVVAILLDRSEMMTVAAIGALKAGSGYQPLDPSYPDDRLAFMVEDSEAVVLITEKKLRNRLLEFKGSVLDIQDIDGLLEEEPSTEVRPEDLFILLYTSGSTGIPKGVALEHRNLTAFIDWYIRYYALDGASRSTAYASFGFDANMMDTYPILCAGGQLHIISEEIRLDFPKLHRYIEDNRLTHAFMTTQVGRQYAKMYPESVSLQHMTVGGETLVPVDLPKYAFYNAYGPTECTILTTVFHVDRRYKNVPIGHPLDNLRLYVVDENGVQVQNGQEGELWVSGPQVARGYWKRPEKTAEVFLSNPFCNEPGYEKVYCTGDIVRALEDGSIEFLGRRDRQVKIRGFRIELSEIEEVIRQFEGIKDATVAAFDKPAGGKYIVAYVVSDQQVDVQELHQFIGKTKPPYMVPAFTLQIDEIPLNTNQKVDRNRLPVPDYSLEHYEAPSTATEKLICEKMALVLGVNAVGVQDDFFQIGGDSISTIMLVTECANPGVNISSIYKYRNPRELAAYCDNLRDEVEEIRAKDAEAMKKILPLTPPQRVNFLLQLEAPEQIYCNNPRLFQLADDVDVDRLKDAVNKVMAHHPVFRTRMIVDNKGQFVTDADGNYQQIYDETLYRPIAVTFAEDFEALKEGLVQPFTLKDGDIWRGGIYVTKTNKYLFLDFHHFIMDGFSVQVLLNEMYECYTNPEYHLPDDFYFYLLESWVHAKEKDNSDEAAAFCEKIFRGDGSLTEEEIPLKPDHEVAVRTGNVKMNPIPVSKDKLRGNVEYLTACALAVAAYNQTDRSMVLFTHYGRNNSMSMNSVGIFINRYPVFLIREDDDTPETLIAKVQEQVSFAEAHIEYPFLENLSHPDRAVRYIYHKDIMSLGKFQSLVKEYIPLDSNDSKMTDNLYGISIVDNTEDDTMLLVERYAENCYDEDSSNRFQELFFEAAKYLAQR